MVFKIHKWYIYIYVNIFMQTKLQKFYPCNDQKLKWRLSIRRFLVLKIVIHAEVTYIGEFNLSRVMQEKRCKYCTRVGSFWNGPWPNCMLIWPINHCEREWRTRFSINTVSITQLQPALSYHHVFKGINDIAHEIEIVDIR